MPQLEQRPSFSLFAVTECHERLMISCLHPGQIVFPPRFGPVATQPSLRVWLRLPLILALLLAAALLTLALVRSPV